MKFKLSVITVCYNAEEFIDQTINSVIQQSYGDVEYIIIDGGSTDSTVKLIQKYSSHIDKWLSEKDGGIADAMNKGLSLATGDYVIYLNADDYFKNKDVLLEASNFLSNDVEILACGIDYLKQNGETNTYFSRGFGFWMNFKTCLFHQGVLCSRQLLNELGGFDVRFNITMDYDLFLRAYRRNAKLKKAHMIMSVMRDVGISSAREWGDLKTRFAEEKFCHYKNNNKAIFLFLYGVYWIIYPKYRFLKEKFHIG